MICYSFLAASGATSLDQTFLFSNDEAALGLAKDYDNITIPCFERPDSVSHDTATSDETVQYFLNQFPTQVLPEFLVILQPTSPLRTSQDIDAAVQLFLDSDATSLVSVNQARKPIHWTYEQTEGNRLKPAFQDNKQLVIPNGAIYIVKTANIMSGMPIAGENMIGYEMPWFRSMDVDTLEEMVWIETFFKQKGFIELNG